MTTWRHYGDWTMSLLSWTVFTKMYQEGKDCNPIYLEFKNGLSSYYQTEEALVQIKQVIVEKAKVDPSFLNKKLQSIKEKLDTDIETLKEINSELERPNPNLVELFGRYWQ